MPPELERHDWHDAVSCGSDRLAEIHALVGLRRLLVVGDGAAADATGCEIRTSTVPVPLDGLVAFETGQGWAAIVVPGTGQGSPMSWATLNMADGDHPVVAGRQWFEGLWPGAVSSAVPARFAPGDAVTKVGASDVWYVTATELTPHGWQYDIARDGHHMRAAEDGLLMFEGPSLDPYEWMDGVVASADDFALALATLKLGNPLTDTVYSYLSTKTVFRPYQFRPLLRLQSSPHGRLLIADEVGLGKTIEAGLIWTELDQRSGVHRALVVCPASLVDKWCSELKRRFDRDARPVRRADLTELVDQVRSGSTADFIGVASLEMLRTAPQLVELAQVAPRFDLVIVDEAHYMRGATTASHALGRLLSDWADVLIFLSATPLNLGQDDLFNLVNLLVEEEFSDRAVFAEQMAPNRHLNALARGVARAPDRRPLLKHLDDAVGTTYGAIMARRPEYRALRAVLERKRGRLAPDEQAEIRVLLGELNSLSSVLTRTRKAEVKGDKVVRTAWSIPVEWTEAEALLYATVRAWATDRAMQANGVVGFATQMPLRQAASCLPALRELLTEKHPELAVPAPSRRADDFDDVLGPGGEESLDASDVEDPVDLDSLLSAQLRALGSTDTRMVCFLEALERLRAEAGVRQVMVFSFFRRTLGYVARRLRDAGYSVEQMHGGVPMADRARLMERFRAGEFDVLCLSEVGAEGLDFEFCQAVVNYDLPWNPMRVEQRIGRIDRFGQPHERIFILNFHVPGTIETDIFERLYTRIRVFEESIGELEPILREELTSLQKVVLDPRLSEDERAARAEAVATTIEARRIDLDDLAEAEGYLSGMDALLIEGLERSRREGRFIGRPEMEAVMMRLLRGTGAKLRRKESVATLIGTPELRARVEAAGPFEGASRYGWFELLARLNDGEPIYVTFDNEEASRSNVELLGVRHPLIRAALAHVGSDPVGLARFGSVVTSGASPGRFLVGLWLVHTTGLRPQLELWPVAVDVETGVVVPEVATEVLSAAAEGRLRDGPEPTGSERERLKVRFREIEHELERRRSHFEQERRAVNEATVDARLKAKHDAIDLKVRRAEQTLKVVEARTIRRLHEGRIRNLERQRGEVRSDLDAKRGLAVTTEIVAVTALEVEPA